MRWMGRVEGDKVVNYLLRCEKGSEGEQIVFLSEPSPSDPSSVLLKLKPHYISEILF